MVRPRNLRPRNLGLLALAAVAATFALARRDPELAKVAHATPAAPIDGGPRVAILATEPDAARTDVYEVAPGAREPARRLGAIAHVPDAAVQGAVIPGTDRVLVVADVRADRDPSWASSLYEIQDGGARLLCDRVYHATRPLVTVDGRVFVQRGQAGPPAFDADGKEQLRVDALTIDEVDLARGATRVVFAWPGYELHLAAAIDDELIVSRVGPDGADLVAIDRERGAVRPIVASWPPFARDFSLDASTRSLVLQQRAGDGRWIVERVALASGAITPVGSSAPLDLQPFAWPGGGVLVRDRARGEQVIDRAAGAPIAIERPLWVRAERSDHAWLAAIERRASSEGDALPRAHVVRVDDGATFELPRPPAARVEIAGFLGGAR